MFSRLLIIGFLLCSLCARNAIAASLQVTGADIEVAFESSIAANDQAKITVWLQRNSESLALLYGRFPVNQLTINVVSNPSNQAVPFARVKRGRIDGLVFYVDPSYPLEDFFADWKAPHEFAHLLIPYPGYDDIWLSEGLASLYQNFLPVVSGTWTEQQAWQGLVDGFNRGRRDNNQTQYSLSELAPLMHETSSFRRVYWSGAAFFLAAAKQLQLAGTSLPQTLEQFQRCCRQLRINWNGDKFVQRLDQFNKEQVFETLYTMWQQQHSIPQQTELLAWYGVQVRSQQVSLSYQMDHVERRLALYRVDFPAF
ncbi:hypothetical protein GCM10011369_21670 [Neiella marina]|uniref:Peptidase M61 catalytic domain-containing protein n=1 Tax=Neiella marina TaxID=508461 RepID=A0A8J2U5P1_9GAMM|nr:hypothetical protein GCM10011369_21670 [Neiella marina]